MKVSVLLAGAGAMAAGCSNNSGEDDWRLDESRSIVANNDELMSGLAASVAQGEFRVPVPVGVERDRIALGAVGKLAVGRGARVIELGGTEFGTLSGVNGVELGDEAQAGSIYNAGATSVILGQKSAVHGFIRSAAEVRQAATARVDLGVIDRDADRLEEFRWRVKFPEGSWGDPVARGTDQAPLDLKPGPYGTVVIEAGATAIIHSGAYYIRSLQVGAGAVVEIDNSYGPVFLWVRESLALGGTMMEYEAARSNLLIGYAGTTVPAITGAFRGTLVAPAADVELPAGGANHVGAVFARAVHLADGAVFEHRAFQGADADYAAAPDYGTCAQTCRTQYQTTTIDCGNVYRAGLTNCDGSYATCATAVLLGCGPAFGAGPWAYLACTTVTTGVCGAAARGCYSEKGAIFSACQNTVNISYQVCGGGCR